VSRWGICSVLLALACAGCVTTEVASFRPKANQQTIIRDGMAALSSRQAHSVVTISPATREMQVGGRPVYSVQMQNIGRAPITFIAEEVSAAQVTPAGERELKVFTYEELASEERGAHTGRVVVAALAAGAGSYSAGNSYWRQAHASEKNAQMANDVSAAHARNMASLEGVLKSNTLMPGQSYGGLVTLSPPESEEGGKQYVIRVKVGPDRHEIVAVQGAAKR
jgi:hypothetical protein